MRRRPDRHLPTNIRISSNFTGAPAMEFRVCRRRAAFLDNNDYVGDVKLEQGPLYDLQVHLIYDLSPRQWNSINSNYFFGGDTYEYAEYADTTDAAGSRRSSFLFEFFARVAVNRVTTPLSDRL